MPGRRRLSTKKEKARFVSNGTPPITPDIIFSEDTEIE